MSAERTGGAYSLFEAVSPPGGGPPPHVQHREDECFYVLEGEFEFLVGDEVIVAGAGSLLYVPKGCLHAHKNVGSQPGRLLLSQTPGGLHERFFEEIGEPPTGGVVPATQERFSGGTLAAFAAKYGVEAVPTSL